MARAKRSAATAPVALPQLIQGPWTSLVVLTYGADLTFFESHLLRQLSQVPLRILMADDVCLAETLSEAAATGQSHKQANRSYLVAPIRHARAAHAKVVLLTSNGAGRLLIGSGNLSQNGYATPGELWHVYSYDESNTAFADEFAAARQFIDTMAKEHLLDPPVCEALSTAWSLAPWLSSTPVTETTIRDNHTTPLATQFVKAVTVTGQPVQQLTVHAPFYDTDAKALRLLIDQVSPRHVRVLLRKDTSVNPKTLLRALDGTSAQLLEVSVRNDDTYIHAKWIHAATPDHDILLTGSPNLSGPALLSDWAGGNIEAGVIQSLARDDVDELYQPLTITPIDDLSTWDLKVETPAAEPMPAGPRLLWSQLQGHQLRLAFTATFEEALLHLSAADGTALTFKNTTWNGTLLTITLDPNQVENTVKPGGHIGVRIGDLDADGNEPPTVASWPYQLEHIASRLKTASANRLLDKVGSLPEADKELYELLTQLEQSLIFDPVTAWKTVHPNAPPPPDDEGGQNLAWKDIDWSKLKRSTRFGAYHYLTAPGIAHTDIEVILASISAQLGKLPQPEDEHPGDDTELGFESSEVAADPELAEEREAEEEPPEDELTGGLSVSTRTRAAFGRLFKRFRTAIANDEFVAELGPTVTVHNAVIVHHVLNRLLERDGVDRLIAADTHLAIWKRLWGDESSTGLIAALDAEERTLADDVISRGRLRENVLLAVLNHAYDKLVVDERRPVLRAQAQHFATDPVFALDAQLCFHAAPKNAKSTVTQLWAFASRLGDLELRAFVLSPLGVSATAGRWDSVPVMRAGGGSSQNVKILTVTDPVPLLDSSRAVAALARLAMASCFNDELHRDYWRIKFAENKTMCFWDERAHHGLCVTAGAETELYDLDLPWPAWWTQFEEVQSALSADAAA
jgi:hypothetical protein